MNDIFLCITSNDRTGTPLTQQGEVHQTLDGLDLVMEGGEVWHLTTPPNVSLSEMLGGDPTEIEEEEKFYQERIAYLASLSTGDPRGYQWSFISSNLLHAQMIAHRGTATPVPYHRARLRAYTEWVNRIHDTAHGESDPERAVPVPRDYPFKEHAGTL